MQQLRMLKSSSIMASELTPYCIKLDLSDSVTSN